MIRRPKNGYKSSQYHYTCIQHGRVALEECWNICEQLNLDFISFGGCILAKELKNNDLNPNYQRNNIRSSFNLLKK